MPILIDQKTILPEINALKIQNYIVKQEVKKIVSGTENVLAIEIIAPKINQKNGVIFLIESNNYTSTMTFLDKKDLNAFIKNFPTVTAPAFAKVLDLEPPTPNDVIINSPPGLRF